MPPAENTLTSFAFDPAPPATVPAPQFPADIPPALAARFRESHDWFNYGGYPTGGPGWAHLDGAPNLPGGAAPPAPSATARAAKTSRSSGPSRTCAATG